MWGVAFVETRCAGSLGGSGRLGWGVWDWGLFRFCLQDCPSLSSRFLWNLCFPLSLHHPHFQLCFESLGER